MSSSGAAASALLVSLSSLAYLIVHWWSLFTAFLCIHLWLACLQCFDAVGWVAVKSRLVLPFWYRLTRVVLDKGPLNGCVCYASTAHPMNCWMNYVFDLSVCVCVLMYISMWLGRAVSDWLAVDVWFSNGWVKYDVWAYLVVTRQLLSLTEISLYHPTGSACLQ